MDASVRSDTKKRVWSRLATFLDRLNVHTVDGYDVREQVLALVEHHLRPVTFYADKPRNSAFRRLSHKVDLTLLSRVSRADVYGRAPKPKDGSAHDWFDATVASLDLRQGPPAAILMGRHLLEMGVQPGPRMGAILKAVYEQQMDGSVTTLDEARSLADTVDDEGCIMPSQTVVLQMDAYHDMVAEVSALKSQVERLQGLQKHDANEIRTLRVANKDFFQQLQEALHDNVRLHKELRLARQQPRMFKTVKVE
jgi:hypothetical protein